MKFVLGFLLWLGLACGTQAEHIGLRDGRSIEGEVIRRTPGEIVVKTTAGIATYRLIELDEATVQRFLGIVTNPVVPAVVQVEATQPKDMDAAIETFARQAGILWVLAKILAFVAWVWWVVAGFKSSVWWGIAMLLFQPCANVFLVIFQWDNAKVPFFLSLTTGVLIAIPLVRFFV